TFHVRVVDRRSGLTLRAALQREQDCRAQVRPRDEVRVGAVGTDSFAALKTRQREPSGHSAGQLPVAPLLASRPGLALQAVMRNDEVLIPVPKSLVGKPESLHHAGRERLHQHIRNLHELAEHLDTRLRPEVEGHGKLARVMSPEIAAAVEPALAVGIRAAQPRGIRVGGGFNLYDLGAEVGQDSRGRGAGNRGGDIKDAHASQWELVCLVHQRVFLSRGSRTSRKASPRKLAENTNALRARPGKMTSHGACSPKRRALPLSMPPSEGAGGAIPSPRKLSDASARTALPIDADATTMTMGTVLGVTCRKMIRASDAPMERAAST